MDLSRGGLSQKPMGLRPTYFLLDPYFIAEYVKTKFFKWFASP